MDFGSDLIGTVLAGDPDQLCAFTEYLKPLAVFPGEVLEAGDGL
ncbi:MULTISPECIES: hypothetical protein [Paracoccus]|nr:MULTISPECIES: hypothetical protein [Paracoccus]MDF3903850.1 hypothetical protein [Paracoccus sp. AS002]